MLNIDDRKFTLYFVLKYEKNKNYFFWFRENVQFKQHIYIDTVRVKIQSVLTAFWKAFFIFITGFKSYTHLLLGSKMSKPYKTSVEILIPSKT